MTFWRIWKDIKQRNKVRPNQVDGKSGIKTLWTAVRQLVGRKQDTNKVESITAESLNSHYASISTDKDYLSPPKKHTTSTADFVYFTESKVFRILDTLKPTATGLDWLPACYLRIGAPVFYKPLAASYSL